ncbi:hypothetical protein PFBG_03908 [Plasmodium falciparum 7G8]|uniref:Uncharacterized protein n=2 Tax=Plasmodium falciparum TaxID=5833 RepID=A0A024V524_PLAFA|nr:hypothetical protein PFFVO_03467 [Plasmodium falciparum Vietnam Oak-Knoll (FVO)]EUR68677.1 hypothetical protein PFBG_03908 [Plasmodium falciparum 7G8]
MYYNSSIDRYRYIDIIFKIITFLQILILEVNNFKKIKFLTNNQIIKNVESYLVFYFEHIYNIFKRKYYYDDLHTDIYILNT